MADELVFDQEGRSVWTVVTRQGWREVHLAPCPACKGPREPVETLGGTWLAACMDGCDRVA